MRIELFRNSIISIIQCALNYEAFFWIYFNNSIISMRIELELNRLDGRNEQTMWAVDKTVYSLYLPYQT